MKTLWQVKFLLTFTWWATVYWLLVETPRSLYLLLQSIPCIRPNFSRVLYEWRSELTDRKLCSNKYTYSVKQLANKIFQYQPSFSKQAPFRFVLQQSCERFRTEDIFYWGLGSYSNGLKLLQLRKLKNRPTALCWGKKFWSKSCTNQLKQTVICIDESKSVLSMIKGEYFYDNI